MHSPGVMFVGSVPAGTGLPWQFRSGNASTVGVVPVGHADWNKPMSRARISKDFVATFFLPDVRLTFKACECWLNVDAFSFRQIDVPGVDDSARTRCFDAVRDGEGFNGAFWRCGGRGSRGCGDGGNDS